jgi:hypothetical protein
MRPLGYSGEVPVGGRAAKGAVLALRPSTSSSQRANGSHGIIPGVGVIWNRTSCDAGVVPQVLDVPGTQRLSSS